MPEKLRKAIPLGMATIIGVLAVLGVEGEDVYWGESGPNLRGDASTTASVKVSSREHRYACIYSALTDRAGKNGEDSRQTTVFLDLNRVAVPAAR